MKKKTWRWMLESCVFLVLLLAVFAGVSRLVERKESGSQFGPFLDEPEQYDVLFFGDSRFVNAMFPMELWADYGIPGYNLSCYGSTMPICYWSMINALDYGEPEVVVIAANGVRKDIKLTGSSEDLHSALDFFPLSLNKVREHVYEEDCYSKWSNNMFPLTTLEDAVWDDAAYFLDLDRAGGQVLETMGEDAAAKTQEVFGAWQEGMEVQVEITDNLTGETLVSRQF